MNVQFHQIGQVALQEGVREQFPAAFQQDGVRRPLGQIEMDPVPQALEGHGPRPELRQRDQRSLDQGIVGGQPGTVGRLKLLGGGRVDVRPGRQRPDDAGRLHGGEGLRRRRALHRHVGVAQQRAAKGAVAHEVQILLALDQIIGQFFQGVGRLGGEPGGQEAGPRFPQVLQALGGGSFGELVEVDGVVHFLEMLVVQVGVAGLRQQIRLGLQGGPVGSLGVADGPDQEVEDGPGLLHAVFRLGDSAARESPSSPGSCRAHASRGRCCNSRRPPRSGPGSERRW